MKQEIIDHLDKVVQKLAIDGVLDDEAVTRYKALITENKELVEKVRVTSKNNEDLTQAVNEQRRKIDSLSEELKTWKRREDELETREEKMLENELIAEFERERVKDHKEMFQLVFRNIEMRRNVFTVVPGFAGTIDEYNNERGGAFPKVEEHVEKTQGS